MKASALNTRTFGLCPLCTECPPLFRIFLVIIHWLKSGYFSQNEMIDRIKLLCETFQHSPSLDSIANEACQLIDVKVCIYAMQSPINC
jgi:hypothetical protein